MNRRCSLTFSSLFFLFGIRTSDWSRILNGTVRAAGRGKPFVFAFAQTGLFVNAFSSDSPTFNVNFQPERLSLCGVPGRGREKERDRASKELFGGKRT